MFSKKSKSVVILSTFAAGVAANGVVSTNTADVLELEITVAFSETASGILEV